MDIHWWWVPISMDKKYLQEHKRDFLDQHIEKVTWHLKRKAKKL